MRLTCINNEGFEDQLLVGETYWAFGLRDGSVFIRERRGNLKWYGLSKFQIVWETDDLK